MFRLMMARGVMGLRCWRYGAQDVRLGSRFDDGYAEMASLLPIMAFSHYFCL